jgi:hypothetical protein
MVKRLEVDEDGERLDGVALLLVRAGVPYMKRMRLWLLKTLYALLILMAREARSSRVIN